MSKQKDGRGSKYTDEFKRRLVAESHGDGVSVPRVSRRHGVPTNRIALARHPTPVKPDATHVFSSKPFFGLFEPVRSGGIYRMSLASGTQSSRGSADG